jgi:pseudouridine-5'-phosphate glycosidase
MLEAIRADLNTGSAAVGRAEIVRAQLEGLRRVANDAEVRRAAEALDTKLADAEMPLVDLRQTGNGQDGVRFAAALLANLGYLANGLAGGDFRPTNQQVEVQALLKELVRTNVGAIDALLAGDLAALNAMLKAKNVPNVIGAAPPPVP